MRALRAKGAPQEKRASGTAGLVMRALQVNTAAAA
jgi:hypothetical protein